MRPQRPARQHALQKDPSAAPGLRLTARAASATPDPRRAHGILAGLAAPRAQLAPKYFYDHLGSLLFEAITALPEYYLTRTEVALLADIGADLRASLGRTLPIVDLGAGSCNKAPLLFDALGIVDYVGLDISAEFLADAMARLRHRWPRVRFRAVSADLEGDFGPELDLPAPALYTYFGSSIGNFSEPAAREFLARACRLCGGGGGLLIGVDLLKAPRILEAAYNDSLGLTAAFNLNILNHVNRMAGTDFSPADWRHVALFEPERQCVAMYLEAQRDVCARAGAWERRFRRGDRVHTEDSRKFSLEAFEGLLADCGFARVRSWVDDRRWFALVLAHA